MNSAAQIPADDFLDQVLSALTASDASTLRSLEVAASAVAAPVNCERYLENRDTLAVLLLATGRNLRILRRVTQRRSAGLYTLGPH